MLTIIRILLLTGTLAISNMAIQAQNKLQELKEKITTTLSTQPGAYAVAFKDLSTGDMILVNEQERFHAASTMKTPVLIEVFKQIKEGKFALDDSVVIKNEFKSIVDSSSYSLNPADDSEPKIYEQIGSKKTWRELVIDMITYSSNLATNMIIEKVGAPNVLNSMRSLGANNIQVLRGVEDGKAFEKGLNNTTTAYDLMIIFEAIAKGKAVSAAASQQMIDILLQQHFNKVIPGKLPSSVKVAHKTGSITGVLHDSGIVFLPNGHKYVLVLLSRDIRSEDEATELLAGISAMIYEYASRD